MCDQLSNSSLAGDKWALLTAFAAAGAIFNNATQNVMCYELPTDLWLDGIWDYQYCTETLPEETYFARDGVHDAFWPYPFDKAAIEARCQDKFGVTPRWTWIREQYADASRGTNIVFTNGNYDPWSAGGILPGSPGDTAATPAYLIDEGAHHLDLFFSNPADPASVTEVRLKQVAAIKGWIADWHAANRRAKKADL
jgi:lysosomal Pro-X carboxypeptidase